MIWRTIIAAFLFFMLGPILLVVVFSFGSNALIGFPMGDLTFDWYLKLLADSGFHAAFWTSGSRVKPTGCGPHPTFVIWPIGRTRSMDCLRVADTPTQSTTRCGPNPSP